MKKIVKNILGALALLAIIGVSASGCVEHRYYREHSYHTRGYYDRHHEPYPSGVNFEIHN